MPTDQPLSTLSTKLHIPPPRADALLRTRLVQRLENGVREGRTLTVISAPAGFGKTTLISAWLQHSQRQAAWLSLDQSDNDPIRFWRYVIAALANDRRQLGSDRAGDVDRAADPAARISGDGADQ